MRPGLRASRACCPSYSEPVATTLKVISEDSGSQLGTITRADDGTITTEGIAEPIFEQIRRGKGWNEQDTFDALAEGGWSNAYATIPALTATP